MPNRPIPGPGDRRRPSASVFRLSAALGLVSALAVSILVGSWAAAVPPAPAWHSGPIRADLDVEIARASPRLAATIVPVALPAGTPAALPDAVAVETEPATLARNLKVGRGDTLMGLLVDAGIDRREAYDAITALRDVFRPRDLKPGQEIRLGLAAAKSDAEEGRLLSLSLQPNVEQDVRVSRGLDGGFLAEAIDRPLIARNVATGGTIEHNLSSAAQAAGLPMPVLVELIRIFSFDVDFQREIQPGDSFDVLYEAFDDVDGSLAKTGRILLASMTLSGETITLYNFTPKSGIEDYFNAKGQSVRKTLMRTPIDGARLSSRFGMRRHPVLGYSRMHKGTDFAAPSGTPIYAAGDGVVETAGRNGGYGNYVRIRHNGTYKTAYAHMSRFAKGMGRGKRVRQGQVIGYVGSTGRSTGPHLHYEVLVDGRQVNPLNLKLPSGEKLAGADLEAFQARRGEIDRLYAEATRDTLMVQAPCAGEAEAGAVETADARSEAPDGLQVAAGTC